MYENGLDLVFGRAKSQAAADKIAQLAVTVGFKGVKTVQESCTVWKAVLRARFVLDCCRSASRSSDCS